MTPQSREADEAPVGEGRGAAAEGRSRPVVFVNGIWKSGNHLVYSALNELGVEGPFSGLAAHLLHGKHAWARQLRFGSLRFGPFPGLPSVDLGLETRAAVRLSHVRAEVRRLRGCILGGHAAYSDRLFGLMQAEGARVIVIRRDPRDVLVSFADWVGSRNDYFLHPGFAPLDRVARIRLLLRGGPCGGFALAPFAEVLDRAAGWLTAPGALQVSFEELIGTQGGGDAAAQGRMLAALHAQALAPKPLAQVDASRVYGGSLTFNHGRVARWRELDDPSLVQEITDRVGPHLARWGYAP